MLTMKRNILCDIYLHVHKNVKEKSNYIFTLYFYKLKQILKGDTTLVLRVQNVENTWKQIVFS